MKTKFLLLFLFLSFSLMSFSQNKTDMRIPSITETADSVLITVVVNRLPYYLEFSADEDFSRIYYYNGNGNNKQTEKRTMKIAKSKLLASGSYVRLRDINNNAFAYPSSSKRFIKSGTLVATPAKIGKDPQIYDEIDLDENTTMSLTSLWYRSTNTNNKIYKGWDKAPGSDSSSITFNHGAIVRNGIIYISRGSYNVSQWLESKKMLWIDRYDLKTGQELDFLRVEAPGDEFKGLQSMAWLRTDDDGTPYFTSSEFETPKFPGTFTLYTLDLDNLEPDAETITPKEISTFSFEATDSIRNTQFYTVTGSIKESQYTIWGAANFASGVSSNRINLAIQQWNVKKGIVNVRRSRLKKMHFIMPDALNQNLITTGLFSKVYPIGDDYFYYHNMNYDQRNFVYSPMLMRFQDDATCSLEGSYANNESLFPQTIIHSSGISMFEIKGHKFLAYAIATNEPAKTSSAIQVVSTPDYKDNFRNHSIVWRIGDETGFSSNRYQGVDVQYFPDENPDMGGQLLVYVPKGGLALYRVDIHSTTVGIDSSVEQEFKAYYSDGAIRFSYAVDDARVIDITGREVKHIRTSTDLIPADDLAPGIYILNIPLLNKSTKIIIP